MIINNIQKLIIIKYIGIYIFNNMYTDISKNISNIYFEIINKIISNPICNEIIFSSNMKITIKTLQGKPTEFEVGEEETLGDLKTKISTRMSINIESQKLIHYGKVIIENDKKLVDYGVKDKDFLVMMVTRKVGAPPAPVPAAPVKESKPASKPQTIPPPIPRATEPPAKAEADPSKSGSLEERLVTGDEYEATISSLMEMGFPREEVVKAMKAAFNNPERATDYLLSGIPSGMMENPRSGRASSPRLSSLIELLQPGASSSDLPPPGEEAPAEPISHSHGSGEEGEGEIEALGDLSQIRQRILEDPSYLQQLLTEIQASNPELYAMVQQNPQAILQILMRGVGEASNEAPSGTISVTPEEKAAIDRLKALGFTEMQAAQAFFACDKNEMMAANFLFENGEALKADEEEKSPVSIEMPKGGVSAPQPAAPSEKKEEQPPEKRENQPPEKKEEESSLQLDPKPEEKKP